MTGICSHLAYAVPHTLIITTNTPANMGLISVWRLTLRVVAAHVPQYLLPTMSSGTYRTQFRSHIYILPTRVRNTLQTICFLKPFLVSLNSLCWSKLLERARLTRQTLLLRSQKSSWPDTSTTSLCWYDRVDETLHDDVIKWKHFPRYWHFVGGIHRSTVDSFHKGQWRGAFVFSLMGAWTSGDLRHHGTHCDITVMISVRHFLFVSFNSLIISIYQRCSSISVNINARECISILILVTRFIRS